MYRIGVDVGGTFTDFVLAHRATGALSYFKAPSTPSDPSIAIVDGIREMLALFGVAAADVDYLGHGTTVATNMIIERRGVLTGLVTTRGFRDVLAIGRQTRPALFDFAVRKPDPLVRRALRLEVAERMDATGQVLAAVPEEEAESVLETFAAAGVESVAVCFLNAYRNGVNEARLREMIARRLPQAFVSISSDVLPEFREYERTSTTVLNAYVGPRMQRYLDRLRASVAAAGITAEPMTIHSNGGLLPVRTVERLPVLTCLSGPAAGVVGAAAIGREIGIPDLVTFDVGGTSTDVSLVTGGRPKFTSERLVAGYTVKMPMIDIHVIGAGGGSIGVVDDALALKVGPRSAGAVPGPVAYDRGGAEPTLTDANIVLNRLNPVALLDGRMPVNREKARSAIAQRIAAPLGLTVEEAAYGMLRIANANMSRAIRAVSTEHGHDLARLALFAFGGAGPLHSADVALECGMPSVVVPQEPGTMCARGVLLSDISRDFSRTMLKIAAPAEWPGLVAAIAAMTAEGAGWLAEERIPAADRALLVTLDARYLGQNHEIGVAIEDVGTSGLDAFLARFHQAHRAEFGYDLPGHAVEVVACRLKASGSLPRPAAAAPRQGGSVAAAQVAMREVYFGPETGWLPTPVYARGELPADAPVPGPAVIEEMSSTIVILPGQAGAADAAGNFIIRLR